MGLNAKSQPLSPLSPLQSSSDRFMFSEFRSWNVWSIQCAHLASALEEPSMWSQFPKHERMYCTSSMSQRQAEQIDQVPGSKLEDLISCWMFAMECGGVSRVCIPRNHLSVISLTSAIGSTNRPTVPSASARLIIRKLGTVYKITVNTIENHFQMYEYSNSS